MRTKLCDRTDPHHSHTYVVGTEEFGCPGFVRLPEEKTAAQRRMEAHAEALANVRTLTNESVRLMLVPNWTANKSVELNVRFRVALVEANATVALAYAISETGSDLEVALSSLASALREGVTITQE